MMEIKDQEAKRIEVVWDEPKKFGKVRMVIVLTKESFFIAIDHDHKHWDATFQTIDQVNDVFIVIEAALNAAMRAFTVWGEMKEGRDI